MTYEEAIQFLYTQVPMYQRVGAPAYKPGLDTSLRLSAAFSNPHRAYSCIHVGGTNGKGSTAHTLAAVLQHSGYRVGLYTSPHLVDFRERIRVNGQMIPQEAVAAFVERYRSMSGVKYEVEPSFFELTMVMAFDWFARCNVDVAVVEVGLGGRLDSTNIIHPSMCVITNISLDHTQFLGDTPAKIAAEKAGIMKRGVPVVIGEAPDPEVREVFETHARETGAPITFADETPAFTSCTATPDGRLHYEGTAFGRIDGALSGDCQRRNTATILTSLLLLKRHGWHITPDAVRRGMADVCTLTGLMGRWMVIGTGPLRVCDTGHNIGGWQYLSEQLRRSPGHKHLVIGFVSDKDVSGILRMMPHDDATYYFTQASIQRAMPADALAALAGECGLAGSVYATVGEAYAAAMEAASASDTVFVGGSTFVVADLLSSLSVPVQA